MTSMAVVTLLQTGVIRHLPDPPLNSFDSDKVNTSDTAYALGAPDGALSLAGLAVNLPVAAFGGVSRAEQIPYVSLAAAVKSGLEAAAAGWYFYQMPAKEKKWCAYCIAGARLRRFAPRARTDLANKRRQSLQSGLPPLPCRRRSETH